ncbi:SMP-30/gluconolactonase/LRE family protein [Aquamicrobium sp. LC103]|uniref:SMP-30/gluconolactonase/LRE family protein n=1 Tax=Aquamicrobium sp. LC103 TaxID=1120658 RepID=UPI0010C9A12B|nr:SMP-30/gluconolactonase/LRE family protein [Aquamicrobium sp. LC103]TKT69637.1 SMP-30/gluconolactonase/LRE family protein [Aquamicrobium sp. LC103]
MKVSVTRIGTSVDRLGESPHWDEETGSLYWIDAVEGIVRSFHLETGRTAEWRLPPPVGSMALGTTNTAIAALKEEFALVDLAEGGVRTLRGIDVDHPDVRINDGKADRAGNFVAGTMHTGRLEGEAPLGGIYRVRPGGRLERLADGFGVANGPCFSPSGGTLYIADTSTRKMWAFDYAPDAPLGEKRLFVDTDALGSGIDGATVDAEGCLWGVLVRAGKVARFTPAGRLDRLIDMPVTHPTSLAFGGPDLDLLFVTSLSRSANLQANEAEAGGLFAVEGLGVRGLPASRFGRA